MEKAKTFKEEEEERLRLILLDRRAKVQQTVEAYRSIFRNFREAQIKKLEKQEDKDEYERFSEEGGSQVGSQGERRRKTGTDISSKTHYYDKESISSCDSEEEWQMPGVAAFELAGSCRAQSGKSNRSTKSTSSSTILAELLL